MPPRRLRLLTILAIPLFSALTMLSITQTWWTVEVADRSLEIAGTVASPALSALALAGFALTAALAISGPVFRIVMGVLQSAIGATVVLAAYNSMSDPIATSATIITEATGVAGTESVAALVDEVVLTGWPWVAVMSGVLSLLVGLFLLFTARRWPVASRKYQAARLEEPGAPRDSVGDWDALSDGSDPTER
ncbi:putative membrane protein (TIGR02234 family) [Glaciihabitans tibetensis]|uniref:Putative membrane protein (TIGR02234 family) n=1 Tax=Glaciihabitans tibetensis TaxID=1266600 RepID=A0A2T0VJK9_9MICO|nr:Trp biosynthesis-associated membrane protein [Glaciihabitans tibetensis]PRY70398.1 putative membrane protein (TIGR02234 family) [Glaciihabitans tibetensis]